MPISQCENFEDVCIQELFVLSSMHN